MNALWNPALGAIVGDGGTSFLVWAPRPRDVQLLLRVGGEEQRFSLERLTDGYWSRTLPDVGPGTRYAYTLDGAGPYPDPCSRSQPEGVHGWSEVVDPASFVWADEQWKPPSIADLVFYECHVGTLTHSGTFDAAIEQLPRLRDLGITAVELMPVAAFAGRRGWGYDGVDLYAPSAIYGGPGGLRRFVNAAHRSGLAVFLDVVLNHFGPSGNYTGSFSDQYVRHDRQTPWGDAINFDGPGSAHVRRFYRESLLHWVREYHVDGFRFDATHAILDRSDPHILSELSAALKADARSPYLFAETNENNVRYLRPREQGGFGFDGVWADDFHHTIRVALEHDHDGYFGAFTGSASEIARTVRHGFLYEGQRNPVTGRRRGTRARDVPWTAFVYSLQNHDQVGNRAFGERLNVTGSHARLRAATLLFLLLPQLPLLFQGQDVFADEPFLFFADHEPGLAELVTAGRRKEFAAFAAFRDPATRELIPDPQAADTFLRCCLDLPGAMSGSSLLTFQFHRELLAIRRDDPVLRAFRETRLPIVSHGLGGVVWALLEAPAGQRWLIGNFGDRVRLPLDLPGRARVAFHTNEGRFGGNALAPTVEDGSLIVPPETGVLVQA